MADKRAATDFPKWPEHYERRQEERRYNTRGYYEPSRRLGQSRDERPVELDDADEYDDFNRSKSETYEGEGYYGSNYGGISERNRGRDIEGNAGYRDSYEHLDTGQWREVQEAADRRGVDLHWRQLQERGVHSGKGPRSYQRFDFRINEDVHDVLLEDPYIDATDIEVKVEKGEVILTGFVENRGIKRRVEDVIEDQVPGIIHLENRLRLRHPGGQVVNVRTSGPDE